MLAAMNDITVAISFENVGTFVHFNAVASNWKVSNCFNIFYSEWPFTARRLMNEKQHIYHSYCSTLAI